MENLKSTRELGAFLEDVFPILGSKMDILGISLTFLPFVLSSSLLLLESESILMETLRCQLYYRYSTLGLMIIPTLDLNHHLLIYSTDAAN